MGALSLPSSLEKTLYANDVFAVAIVMTGRSIPAPQGADHASSLMTPFQKMIGLSKAEVEGDMEAKLEMLLLIDNALNLLH
jgi:hypothetical protein